jgi:hypothetical protein
MLLVLLIIVRPPCFVVDDEDATQKETGGTREKGKRAPPVNPACRDPSSPFDAS